MTTLGNYFRPFVQKFLLVAIGDDLELFLDTKRASFGYIGIGRFGCYNIPLEGGLLIGSLSVYTFSPYYFL